MLRKYSHVIVVAVDGAGRWFENADTPNFDRIFSDGSVTYRALSSRPTISAECYGSMLLGVGPEIHNLTNAIVSSSSYDPNSPFPSVFRRIREAYPEAELGSYCCWNPITSGIVESNLGVSHGRAYDDDLTLMICDYIRVKRPEFLFIQFDTVDGVGHNSGYGTTVHLQRIHEIDSMIGDVYSSAREACMIDDTLFIVLADHGGTNPINGGGGSHGGWTDEEKYVTFAVTGKGVNKTEIREMNIRDLAAIILYAFGIEAPEFNEEGWTAQIPEGIFDDTNLPKYKDISHLTGAAPRISKTHHTSELI